MVTMEFTGDLGPLVDLKDKKVRLAVRVGVNRAAKPVRQAVVAQAQRIALQGYTAKSIGTKQAVYAGGSVVVVVIGPKRKYSRTKGKYTRGKRKGQAKVFTPAKVAKNVEQGTGRSKKKPFLKPALDAAGGQFQDRLAAEIRTELNK